MRTMFIIQCNLPNNLPNSAPSCKHAGSSDSSVTLQVHCFSFSMSFKFVLFGDLMLVFS